MNKSTEQLKQLVEHTLPWFVLIILLFYSYINLFQHPYGFSWLPDGSINRIFVKQEITPTLEIGDQLVSVGPLSWEEFRGDLRSTLFEGVQAGEVTPVVIDRKGRQLTVLWPLAGFNQGAFINALASQGFLAYFFWLAGLISIVFLRPRDERWLLFTAFNFLTSIWLVTGSGVSNYHLSYGALVLRVAIWLCLPIYLHLHWVFPRTLGRLPRSLVMSGYVIAFGFAIAQWFQLFSSSVYFLAFLIAILGSLILLIVHFLLQAEVRREMGFMVIVGVFAFLPTIALGAAYTMAENIPLFGTIALINFATIPFSYLYIAFRRQLGGLEMRVNRIISAYFFTLLLGLLGFPLFVITSRWALSVEGTFIVISITAMLVALLTIWGFPYFQRFLERSLLGISLPVDEIHQTYSAGTSASTSTNALIDLLRDVMLPNLLIREFIFLQFHNDSMEALLAIGVDQERIINDPSLSKPLLWKTLHAQNSPLFPAHPWVQLAIPLKLGDDIIGLWLFGKRDPDDFYSQNELPMLQSLANQTAIALSNINQTERLHLAYQNDIKLSERERQRFALEIHDDILNNMAALMMKLDDENLTVDFKKLYGELTSRLREMIAELRPATLDFGILPTIEDYADMLTQRLKGRAKITVNIQTDGTRYSQDTELHLLRILQEACTNALQHAGTSQITISGHLNVDHIELILEDNGTGFDPKQKLDLKSLQANGHFGLAGMHERAVLIGAILSIHSRPRHGTRIHVECKPRNDSAA